MFRIMIIFPYGKLTVRAKKGKNCLKKGVS